MTPIAGAQAISSAHGPLRHVLFCFPDEAARRSAYRAAFAGLFVQLPAFTRITVLAGPSVRGDLHDLLSAAGRDGRATVVVAPDDLKFTVWAQDPFVAVEDEDAQTWLVQPLEFQPEGDDAIAEVLAAQTTMLARRSSLCFEGGSVLVGDDFALLGRDCIDAEARRGAEAFREILGRHRRIVVVGTDLTVPAETIRPVADEPARLESVYRGVGTAQPQLHLDMFVSLAGRPRRHRGSTGRYRLLVGSPRMADEILGRPTPDHAMAALFDDVADGLVAEGFDVIRNPLPLTYGDGRRRVEGMVRDVRLWYFASSNNCLVQIDQTEGNHVWLPTYGHGPWRELAATDHQNRSIWEELGFTVHQLTSFHAFAQRLGAAHCITKFLSR